MQGYYFSRPLQAGQIEDFIRQGLAESMLA
jgi:EAL domain-containing protein (putative c-di-GMP-specific phosphodiesterase class I)